jgi:hypothetical protein
MGAPTTTQLTGAGIPGDLSAWQHTELPDDAFGSELLELLVGQIEQILQNRLRVFAESGPAPGPSLPRAPGQPDGVTVAPRLSGRRSVGLRPVAFS